MLEGAADIAAAERQVATVQHDRRARFERRLVGARVWLSCQRGDVVAARSDARRDRDDALALARGIGRPCLEIGCLGNLALAAIFDGSPVSMVLQRCDEAVAIAEAHGWRGHRIVAPAVAAGAAGLVWLGRFDEAERWVQRYEAQAEQCEIDAMLHHAQGFVWLARSARGGVGGVPRGGEDARLVGGRARAPERRVRLDPADAAVDGTDRGRPRRARLARRHRARRCRDAGRGRGFGHGGSPAGRGGRPRAGDSGRRATGRRLAAAAATSRHPRSPPSSSSPPTPSAPTCAPSTRSSAPTRAGKRWAARAGSAF